jgi:predicted  nucleic acid-binding Zn-ribbon protein
MQGTTRLELLSELDQLDAQIAELRIARSSATYDLEQNLRERERLQRHLASLVRHDRHLLSVFTRNEENE